MWWKEHYQFEALGVDIADGVDGNIQLLPRMQVVLRKEPHADNGPTRFLAGGRRVVAGWSPGPFAHVASRHVG